LQDIAICFEQVKQNCKSKSRKMDGRSSSSSGASSVDRVVKVDGPTDSKEWKRETSGRVTPPHVYTHADRDARSNYHYRLGCGGAATKVPLDSRATANRWVCSRCVSYRPNAIAWLKDKDRKIVYVWYFVITLVVNTLIRVHFTCCIFIVPEFRMLLR